MESTKAQGQCLVLAGPGGPLMVGTEAISFSVYVDLRITSVCSMFVSDFGVRMLRCLAREPEKTLAMGIMLVGPGTRQQGQTRGLRPAIRVTPHIVRCRMR